MADRPAALVRAIATRLHAGADKQRAKCMASYMRGKFEFFGVGAAERRARLHAAVRDSSADLSDRSVLIQVVQELWASPQREYHYCAVDLLAKHCRKAQLDAGDLPLVHSMLSDRKRSWWDTVDVMVLLSPS